MHCTASWFTISQGKGGPPLLMTLSLSLSLRLREAAVSSRFTAGSQGHCVMPHNKEHLKTAKAFGKSHCLSSPWAYPFKYLILMTTHFSMPLYSSSLNKQTFFFSPPNKLSNMMCHPLGIKCIHSPLLIEGDAL